MVRDPAGDHSGVMTSIPPEAPPQDPDRDPRPGDAGPRPTAEDVRNVSRIRRTVGANRKVAGVAGGLARHLDVDPVLLRVALVVLAFFGGAGLLLYGALWLLLPEEGRDQAAIRLDERSLLVSLVGVAVLAGLLVAGDSWGGMWFPWPLAVIGLVVLLVVAGRSQPGAPPVPPGPTPPGYRSTADGPTASAPPPYPPRPAPTAPPAPPLEPDRRGPVLFWFTLALVTLALGILGMVDVSGVAVPASGYAALATAIVGVMLLVGSFFGRAGGLILLGLVSATALAGTTVGENLETPLDTVRPATAALVGDRYSHAAGELVLDLSEISDVAALDGRDLTVESGAGRVEVIVPDNVDVLASASVGAGDATLFGTSRDGLGIELSTRRDVPAEVATLTLDVQLGVGEVVVRTATD